MATFTNWMILRVYFTRVVLHKMKKVKTPLCLGCSDTLDTNKDLSYFLVDCPYYSNIRGTYLQLKRNVSEICDNQELIFQTILGWASVTMINEVANLKKI